MGMTEKIKILLVKKNISAVQLAELLGVTPQNIYNKFKRDNFSEKELHEIAERFGCTFEGSFILPDGTKI